MPRTPVPAEVPGNPAGHQKSVALDMGDRPEPDVLAELSAIAEAEGFFASDRGSGVNLINNPFSQQGAVREGVPLGKELKGDLGKRLQDVSGVKPRRASIESGFEDFESAWKEGKGAATKRLFDTLDQNPDAAASLDSPQVRQKALDNIQRDIKHGERLGLPVRDDLQHTRRIFGEEGLDGLRRALIENPELLASVDEVVTEMYS